MKILVLTLLKKFKLCGIFRPFTHKTENFIVAYVHIEYSTYQFLEESRVGAGICLSTPFPVFLMIPAGQLYNFLNSSFLNIC